MNENDKLLTVGQVAERLQVKPGTIRLWIRNGTLKGAINVKPDATRPVYRVRESIVSALLAQTTTTTGAPGAGSGRTSNE